MRLRLVLMGVLALTALGCGRVGPAASPEPPVLIEPSQIEGKLFWSSQLHDRLVSVDGYITLDNGRRGDAIAMGPQLNSEPSGGGDELIRFEAERGAGPNLLQLPVLSRETVFNRPGLPEVLTFDMTKATFQDKAGQPHPLRSKVRVTGRLTYARVGGEGLLSEADAESPGGRRFKPILTDVTLETPPGY